MLFNPLKRVMTGLVSGAVMLGLVASAQAQSEADCAARAERASRDSSGVIGGAAAGALGGAAFGAIVSDKSRKGAKRGAAIGAVAGGASSAIRQDRRYKEVYDACMAGR